MRYDLLRAQRDGCGFLTRQGVSFVKRVGMQGLCSPQYRRQALQRGPHDVVVGLLPGQRAPRGLGVSAKLPATLVLGSISIAHHVRPNGPCSAELSDFLEEIVMGVEEKA